MERSAPQHMPYSWARRNVTAALPSPRLVSNVPARIESRSVDFISASIFSCTTACSSLKSPWVRKNVGEDAMRRRSAFLFATSRASRMVPSEAEARRGARGAARRAGARRPLAHRAAARAQASRHHDGMLKAVLQQISAC